MCKKIILFLFLIPVFALAQSGDQASRLVKLEETTFDFGKIPQGRPVSHLFKLTNVSNFEVKVDHVQASCGCTTPEWSQDPIKPGASTEIKVGFNAEALGIFEKSISIQLSKGSNEVLMIKGQVWQTPQQPAPFNTGLRMIKSKNINGNH